MKILSITAQKPHSTGSGTYLTELIRAWSRMGIEQAVVAGIYSDDKVSFPEQVDFYPVYYTHRDEFASDISFPVVGMSDIMPYESTRYMDMDESMIEEFISVFVKKIRQAVDELNPDVIICHHLFILTSAVREAFPDRKIYGICHGTDLRQIVNCSNLRNRVDGIKQLDYVFALHDEQALRIQELCKVSPDKISVIGSGYNDSIFNCQDRKEYSDGEPVRICYAGKMSKPKGVPELVRALSKLNDNQEIPAFTATFAGGCQDDDVRQLIDDFPDNFEYLGQIPQTDLAKVFKHSDIYVLPSYYEGLNLTTIEAMACGVIPVCNDLPGMREWIDNNVMLSNVHYVEMPDMAAIDVPTDSGKEMFIDNLRSELSETITSVSNGQTVPRPDTSGITWNSVARKILNL